MSESHELQKALQEPVDVIARRLLGCELERLIDGEVVRVRIVETEAYDQSDPASHTFRGKTARNAVMFGPGGFLYVYFIYGNHYCCNVTVGEGAAVLIRAVEPLHGWQYMERRRKREGVEVSNGPGKLSAALGIDSALNGHNLGLEPLRLHLTSPVKDDEIVQTRRIGISQGQTTPWRFFIRGNPYVSRG